MDMDMAPAPRKAAEDTRKRAARHRPVVPCRRPVAGSTPVVFLRMQTVAQIHSPAAVAGKPVTAAGRRSHKGRPAGEWRLPGDRPGNRPADKPGNKDQRTWPSPSADPSAPTDSPDAGVTRRGSLTATPVSSSDPMGPKHPPRLPPAWTTMAVAQKPRRRRKRPPPDRRWCFRRCCGRWRVCPAPRLPGDRLR